MVAPLKLSDLDSINPSNHKMKAKNAEKSNSAAIQQLSGYLKLSNDNPQHPNRAFLIQVMLIKEAFLVQKVCIISAVLDCSCLIFLYLVSFLHFKASSYFYSFVHFISVMHCPLHNTFFHKEKSEFALIVYIENE